MNENERKPWHELPGESSEAYGIFCLYLNMGRERSLSAITQLIDKTPLYMEQLGTWAATFNWARRAELCEQYIDNELGNLSRAHMQIVMHSSILEQDK